MKQLRIGAVGCGARSHTYLSLIAEHHRERFRICAAADPVPVRRDRIRRLARDPGQVQLYDRAEELFAAAPELDLVIVGTQDRQHLQHALRAMDCGYDVVLEKPVGATTDEVLRLRDRAAERKRRIVVCHVLRYTPFYRRIRDLLSTGAVGAVRSIQASEGVGPWHFAHSYVRGHWNNSDRATPMIVAKSCHDTDILAWLADAACTQVSSVGSLTSFRADQAPPGATPRCTDGCPHLGTCFYDAHRYLSDQRHWLELVFDGGSAAPDAEIRAWLDVSDWGRCVYRHDNDAPDHQTAQFSFANGISATLTVTAFGTGRALTIYGTEGVLRAGQPMRDVLGVPADIVVERHGGAVEHISVESPEDPSGRYGGHFGGDRGLVDALYDELVTRERDAMLSSIDTAVEGHRMAFAAEEARQTGRCVDLSEPDGRQVTGSGWGRQ